MAFPEQVHSSLRPSRQAAIDPQEDARDRLIVALDVPSTGAAIALVDRLENRCSWFKVGLELFVAAGPAILDTLATRGHSVFLDLKFHDIPNTVAGAVRSAAVRGVRMMTVHALGGPAMLSAARDALAGAANPPELLAVTVLTSMDGAQLNAVGLVDRAQNKWNGWPRWVLRPGFAALFARPKRSACCADWRDRTHCL